MKNYKIQDFSQHIFYSVLGAIIYISGMLLSAVNQFASGSILISGAVILYLYIVLKVADGNWMDVRAVFTAVWTGTIGLAAFRFAEYQEVWQPVTWLALFLAFLMLQVGATVGIHFGPKLYSVVQRRLLAIKQGAGSPKVQEERLFVICVVTTLIGLLCFCINVAIQGFIPCFSDDVNAYMNFYTKFHIFAVASTAVSGLCFYCIKTQHLAFWKKLVLFLCIFYLVFLFPVMVVSRGVFITVALSLAVTVFYLYRKNLFALIICMVAIVGVYLFTSNLRNYTEYQMNVFFEPAKIELPGQTQDPPPVENPPVENPPVENPPVENPPVENPPVENPPVENPPVENPPVENPPVENPPVENPPVENPPVENPPQTFQLPPKVAFLYSYLTVSHDNLNEAVKHLQNYTWGIRQLSPFNVLLGSNVISETIANAEHYQVNPYLNTTNLIGDFYGDFGIVGVVFCMFLWSFVFGLNQSMYEYSKNIFLLLMLGNTMTPVALCFFATWLSNFNLWMMWGTIFLLSIAACLTFKRKKSCSKNPEIYK